MIADRILGMSMKKSVFLFSLVVFTVGVLTGLQTQGAEAADLKKISDFAQSQSVRRYADSTADQTRLTDVLPASCADPVSERVERCASLERQILASTVRIEWDLWLEDDEGNVHTWIMKSIGHATIKEGRYLVTHNHWQMSLSDLRRGETIRISVFSAEGDPVWLDIPLDAIKIVEVGSETLVLDFGAQGGRGLFEMVGYPSAEFMNWEAVPVQSGTEVAQINWDGTSARVDWVIVDEIITRNGVASLELGSYVLDGISGGGVFWNGYHIANTWYRGSIHRFWDGKVLRQYSVAALNPPPVAVP
jgi:hypothetical protein